MANKKAARLPTEEVRQHRPEELITFRVSVLSQLLSRVVEGAVGGELGLSSRQWRVLVILNRLGPSSSGNVAAATRLDHSQVSRASHELAEKGLIKLDSDGADRRKQMLTVTRAGVDALRQGIVGSQARQKRLRGSLTAEQYAAFEAAMATLTEVAQDMLAEQREGPAPVGKAVP